MITKPKTLIYDIETTPLLAWVWRCGDQTVRHGQLHDDHNVTRVICITYRWLHEKKSKAFIFDLKTLDDKKIIKQFDELIKEADIIIGKNNKRFDDKHINFRRLVHGLDPIPDWGFKSDDLEKQIRKYFNVPSYSLDYFSKQFGLGGKNPMEFKDWVDIVHNKSKRALDKMVTYGKKDADDTAELIKIVWPHIRPKFNAATFHGKKRACVRCGGDNIIKNGTDARGTVMKQRWFCLDCKTSAGHSSITDSGKMGG